MVLRLAAFVCVSLASFTVSVHAQDSTAGRLPARWDLQTCIDYAKKNNIMLNSLRLNVLTAQQNYLLARAARQPNLTGSATATYTHSKNTNPVISGFQTESSFNNDYSLISGITIYNAGAITDNTKTANLQIQSANQTVIENELNI